MKKCIELLATGHICPNDAMKNRNYCAVHIDSYDRKGNSSSAKGVKRMIKKKAAKKR